MKTTGYAALVLLIVFIFGCAGIPKTIPVQSEQYAIHKAQAKLPVTVEVQNFKVVSFTPDYSLADMTAFKSYLEYESKERLYGQLMKSEMFSNVKKDTNKAFQADYIVYGNYRFFEQKIKHPFHQLKTRNGKLNLEIKVVRVKDGGVILNRTFAEERLDYWGTLNSLYALYLQSEFIASVSTEIVKMVEQDIKKDSDTVSE